MLGHCDLAFTLTEHFLSSITLPVYVFTAFLLMLLLSVEMFITFLNILFCILISKLAEESQINPLFDVFTKSAQNTIMRNLI